MYDDDDDEETDEIDDQDVFDLRKAKCDSWESKDRKSATIRLSDPNGLCDMKILLLLQAKVLQMQAELGILDEHGERH